MPVIEHWMQFATFKEQRFFSYPTADTYQGVVINANMAAHAPAGLAGFLLEKTASSRYIIDPLTHAFQHDPRLISNDDGDPKSSILTLAEAYGQPVSDHIGSRPVSPSDFTALNIPEFVARCLRFQRDRLRAEMMKADAAKYLDDYEICSPVALIAPYFYMTESSFSKWQTVNKDLVAESRKACQAGESLLAPVVVTEGLLINPAKLEELLRTYESMDVDGYVVWIDNLDESSAGVTALTSLLDLCRRLRGQDRSRLVLNLHGGYFSILGSGRAGDSALSGVAHGPEFGEYRSVVPVGGGIPIARYYVLALHQRIRFADALRYFTNKGWLDSAAAFHENVCDCPVCKETLDGDPARFRLFGESVVKDVKRRHGLVRIQFPTKDATERCLKHYLHKKKVEYEFSADEDPSVLIEDLDRGFKQYEGVAGVDAISHLSIWSSIYSGKPL